MAVYRPYFILSITIFLSIIFSSCHTYQLFRDIPIPNRPLKYHILNEPDRHVDRMKQYHDTIAQLKHWGRSIDDFDNDILHPYKSSEENKY
ncbi:hypothetical protein I4U23_024625 [Adineta vaga]|nr:hypothetical protein I4U23_024625 [Adineta vaga]